MRRKVRKNEWKFLRSFAEGEEYPPFGMGDVTTANFVYKNWIVRIEAEQDFDAPRYRITEKGLADLKKHDVSISN